GFVLEYPETSATGAIGHLFPVSEIKPTSNVLYSFGQPNGSVKSSSCNLFVGPDSAKIPCKLTFKTCQGIKACPYADLDALASPHVTASREAIAHRLSLEQQEHADCSSSHAILFQKTLSYLAELQKQGCSAPPHEATHYSGEELEERELRMTQLEDARRGHAARPTCNGRLLFRYNSQGRPFVVNIDHFIDYNAGGGLYHTEYLEALFLNDREAIAEFEEEGFLLSNTGPHASCPTVANISSIKVNCVREHRDVSGNLDNPALIRQSCDCKFLVYEPYPEYAQQCPWVLMVCRGVHSHPIPLPTKTPPRVRDVVFTLLERLDYDLADLTPRRFLRHPSTTSYLRELLPHDEAPTLLDLHPSLGNRDHIRSYIVQVQRTLFPDGTGWDGLLHLKHQQDEELLPEDAYIRVVEEYPALGLDMDEDDEQDCNIPFRIAICMFRACSDLLLKAKYVQSDISHQRMVGFKEFELGGLQTTSRISIPYCRIYVNRQTAAAHQIIFQKISDLVLHDTGTELRWRHIHATDVHQEVGILHFAMDQHGGQAKGLGLYLHAYAQRYPGKMDLHEDRLLTSLDEYDHLARVARLCTAHIYRNIGKADVSEGVRNLMRSLVCMEHSKWDEMIERIIAEGGRAGANWVADKIRSKFAFAAMCWEKSFIPRAIWQVGDNTSNIIESLHADANREGVSCSLVGGVKKGRHFDTLKIKTLWNLGSVGIRPGYARGHVSETTKKSLKRKATAQHRVLEKEDARIENQNKRLKAAYDSRNAAERRLSEGGSQVALERAVRGRDHAQNALEKAVTASRELAGSGSGKVGLLLPASDHEAT
ncbi:hypothetical protein GGX14DRAFT_363314, partial [Mycena pura]